MPRLNKLADRLKPAAGTLHVPTVGDENSPPPPPTPSSPPPTPFTVTALRWIAEHLMGPPGNGPRGNSWRCPFCKPKRARPGGHAASLSILPPDGQHPVKFKCHKCDAWADPDSARDGDEKHKMFRHLARRTLVRLVRRDAINKPGWITVDAMLGALQRAFGDCGLDFFSLRPVPLAERPKKAKAKAKNCTALEALAELKKKNGDGIYLFCDADGSTCVYDTDAGIVARALAMELKKGPGRVDMLVIPQAAYATAVERMQRTGHVLRTVDFVDGLPVVAKLSHDSSFGPRLRRRKHERPAADAMDFRRDRSIVASGYPDGLSGFLVVIRGPRDDIPVGLFDNEEAAWQFAKDIDDDEIARCSGDFVGDPPSRLIGTAVVEFRAGVYVGSALRGDEDEELT